MKANSLLRRLVCLFICFAMVLQPMTFLPVIAGEEPTNLFANGTFADADQDGKADNWNYYSSTTNPEAPSTVGEDGITITGENGKRLTIHQSKYGLTPGETYHLSFRYRVSSYSSQSLLLRYVVGNNTDKTSTTHAITQVQSVTDGWVRIDKDIVLPENYNYIKVEFVVNPNAVLTCSIDDVSLTQGAKSVTAPSGTNLFQNGDFSAVDANGKAKNWSYYFNDGTRTEADSSVGEDGITIVGENGKRLTIHQTKYTLTGGKTYRLGFRYRVSAYSSSNLLLRYVVGHNGDNGCTKVSTTHTMAQNHAVTDGWVYVEKDIVLPENCNYIKVEFMVNANAALTCSVDDVYLVEVAQEEPEVPETTVPETTVPETTVPETTVPETTAPVEPEYVDTLLKNGTFLDGSDEGMVPDYWTFWNGSVTAAATQIGEDGLTINADSSVSPQRLSVHQTVNGLDASKTYRFTGTYNVTATSGGALDIGYYENAGSTKTSVVKVQKTTGGVQTFEVMITGMTSVKLEAAVSQGANMSCTINDFKLEEVVIVEEPAYQDTLLKNGTFLDGSDEGEVPDFWNFWNGTVAAAATQIGEDGLTINAVSTSDAPQRLSVNQVVSGLDAEKTYCFSGSYNITSKSSGALDIGYYANATGGIIRERFQNVTNGVQTFEVMITGVTSVKLEAAVSQGATMSCTLNNFKLEEVEALPDYQDTLLKNGTFLDGSDEGEVPDSWTFWNGSSAAATASLGEDGLTITADSTNGKQRLSVNQTVTGLDAAKFYRFTGTYNITAIANGALDIGYYANATGSVIRTRYMSGTSGVKSFEIVITGMTSVKLEAAVSDGANMTCTINDFKLEEIPESTVTFDANGGTGSMEPMKGAGSIVLPECGFTAPVGYQFAGWLVNGEVKAPGETITFGSDITVKAQWDDGNLLQNPRYGTEDISVIPGWTYYPKYADNAGTKYTATVSDGVFAGTVNGGSNLILHQVINTDESIVNKTYRFTAEIKTDAITGYAMFKIYLQNSAGKQLHVYSSAQFSGKNDWTTVTFEFDVPASVCGEEVASIKLEQYILDGSGTASFRNPSIKEIGVLEQLTEGDPVNSLVLNGGYEYTLSGAPALWQVWESTGGLKVESDREVLVPTLENNYSSLHLSNVTPGADSRGSVHQTFQITGELEELWGQSVKIGQWVKTENFEGDALALRVHYATVSGSYVSKSLPVQKTQDWTYYEFIIDLPNTNFKTIKVENLYDYGQGDVWIDNTVVTKYIKAKSLDVNLDYIAMSAGNYVPLFVEYKPANTTIQEVTFTSSDPSVAKVENGNVYSISNGVATITITHVDGMSKQIGVLVADEIMEFTESISVRTPQNTTAIGELPEGYTYQVIAEPQFGTFLVENGAYTYYPAKDFSGADTVTLLVTSDAGQCLVVVPLGVTAVNSAPEFDRMTIVTKVGQSVTGDFAATDPENDDIVFSVVKQPENGTVTIDGNTYTFTPNAGFQGYDAVTFAVSDGDKTTEKEVTVYVAADADYLLDTVKADHTRLLADDARFEELKNLIATDENAIAWFAIIKRDADKLLDDPTPVPYECPDGVRLNTQGSKDVLNLAFMYRLTGDEAYLNRAKLELLNLCGLTEETYIDWHPSHLLDTAMTANGVAIAYDWLYSALTAGEKAQVEEAIYRNALVEARRQFEGQHMFVTNGENWNYICNGGFITAALALAHHENEEYNALAGEILQRCYSSIQYGLPQYAPEGASIEGISYWDYGTRYLVSLLATISSATNVENPFLDAPGLNITAEYPIYLSGKAGSYNYSDNDLVDAYGYLNMWLAHTYKNYSWNWYHKYYMEKGNDPTIYDLLYYYPDEYEGDAPENLDKFYTNQAVTTMRHDFTDPMSSFLGFKGGLNGAPHGDVDIGSFIYDIYGLRWAEDFGKDDYNVTGYWEIAPGGTRWNYYRKNAMGHNTLVFNPTKGANQTVGAYAGKIEQSINNPGGGYTILDMTDAYQENAVDVLRGFAYFNRTQVLIRDEFTLKAPGTAYWQMHTKASVEISEDGKTAILTQEGKTLLLKLVGENAEDGLKFESMEATTYEGVEYEGLKSNEGYTKVYVKASGVQKAVFNVLITPEDLDTPEVKALDAWSEYDFTELNDSEDNTPAEITGVSITVDGVTYTEGPVTITPNSTVSYTVTGTNFANLAKQNELLYAEGFRTQVHSVDSWIIDANANTATRDFTDYIHEFASCDAFEVLYSNDNFATEEGTGIYLTYDDGVTEEPELSITKQPESYEGMVNDTVTFTVEATGEGLTYQWYYAQGDSEWSVSGAAGCNTASLTVQLLAYRNGQRYRCQITDAHGNTVTTDAATMTIQAAAVEITQQPTDVINAVVNQVYTFTVQATGDVSEYRWESSTDGGATWNLTWLDGYNTSTLTVAMYAYRSGNMYRCRITGLENEVVSEAAVMKLPESTAQIITQPTDVTVAIGEPVSFTVTAQGDCLSYTWFRSYDDGATWTETWLDGYNTNTLYFSANVARQSMYKCRITDSSNQSIWTDPVRFSLKTADVALEIIQQPVSQELLVGQTASFTVIAQGEGLTYTWYRSYDEGATWTGTWLDGYNTATLTFEASANRCSMYRCQITDAYGNTVTSDPVSLKLQEIALQILVQPQSLELLDGQTASFTVVAQGQGLTYAWYRSYDEGATWTGTWLDGYNTATLSFATNANRCSMYRCQITDAFGNTVISDPVSLKLQQIELRILTQPQSQTKGIRETVSFTVTAEGQGLSYRWYASLDGESWTETWLDGYNTATLSFEVDGPRVNKVYKCVITDYLGNTVETDSVKVTVG